MKDELRKRKAEITYFMLFLPSAFCLLPLPQFYLPIGFCVVDDDATAVEEGDKFG